MSPRLVYSLPLAGLVASLALADGRIPLAMPTTISVPGHYVVTRDIAGTGPLGFATVEIMSTDVLLDLDGHSITGGPGNGTAAIYLGPPAQTSGSIEIRNGQVRGGSRGIFHPYDAASRLRLEGLDISGGSMDPPVYVIGAPVVEVVGCTVHDVTSIDAVKIERGFRPQWTGAVTGNRVRKVVNAFVLHGMAGGVVSDNVVTDYGSLSYNSAYAMELSEAEGTRVERNVLHGDTSSFVRYGIYLFASSKGCAIVDNVISGDMSYGIIVYGDGNLLSGNTIGGSKSLGIDVPGNRNTLTGNTVESGSLHGVHVFGQFNLLDGNTIEGHAGTGLQFVGPTTNNAYRRTLLHNNLGGTVSGTATDAGGNLP